MFNDLLEFHKTIRNLRKKAAPLILSFVHFCLLFLILNTFLKQSSGTWSTLCNTGVLDDAFGPLFVQISTSLGFSMDLKGNSISVVYVYLVGSRKNIVLILEM